MKSIIKKSNPVKDIKFPCLMINRVNGNILLFREKGIAVMVYSDSSWLIGVSYKDLPMGSYEPFHGTIELSSED